MPYANHQSLTLSGTIGPDGAAFERFSFGISLSDPGVAATDTFSLDRFNDLVTDCTAFFGRAGTRINGSFCTLREVKWARLDNLGRYRQAPFIRAVAQNGGGAGGLMYPPQVSLAVSLVTGKTGPRGRGRFYLPIPAVTLSSDGLIEAADAAAVRDSCAVFLNAVNNWPGFDGASPKVTVASSFGQNHDVTGVRVGRGLDTIRSRRADLVEKYGTTAAVA